LIDPEQRALKNGYFLKRDAGDIMPGELEIEETSRPRFPQ
jgi:hypothetical protein